MIASTLSITFKPISEWLFIAVGGLLALGGILSAVVAWMGGELEVLVPLVVCWTLALVVLILAVGSML
jgi:hypothetical protein